MNIKIITNALSAVLALGLTSSVIAEAPQHSNNKAGQEMANMPPIQGMERCYGITLAGRNDCGTASHSCAGEAKQNGAKNEWMYVPTGLCNKIVGGSLKLES